MRGVPLQCLGGALGGFTAVRTVHVYCPARAVRCAGASGLHTRTCGITRECLGVSDLMRKLPIGRGFSCEPYST